MSDFHSHTKLIGRKEHQCEGCGCAIHKGEKHLKVAQVFDGDFHAYRLHLDCQQAVDDYHTMAGLLWDEHAPWPREMGDECDDDWEWLKEKFPAVAQRIAARKAFVRLRAPIKQREEA